MFNRHCSLVTILLAVAVGLLFQLWPKGDIARLLFIPQFLEAVLPVLAIGALIKYLIGSK